MKKNRHVPLIDDSLLFEKEDVKFTMQEIMLVNDIEVPCYKTFCER